MALAFVSGVSLFKSSGLCQGAKPILRSKDLGLRGSHLGSGGLWGKAVPERGFGKGGWPCNPRRPAVLSTPDLERVLERVPAKPSLSDLPFTGLAGDSLERALVAFEPPSADARHLGVGVVLTSDEGARIEILDLGSGVRLPLPASPTLTVFGWIFPSSARALRDALSASSGALPMGPILRRVGYSPLSHAAFVRAGFRDLAEDIDPHESCAIRLHLPSGGVLRAHADPSRGGILLRSSRTVPDASIDALVRRAFPGVRLASDDATSSSRRGGARAFSEHWVPLPPAQNIAGLQDALSALRAGFMHVMAAGEPARHAAVRDALIAFGVRDLLGRWFPRPSPLPTVGRVQ